MNLVAKLFNSKKQIELVENNKGLHYFGGQKPDEFNIPENSFLGNFQYIGFISKKDKHFESLPFDLHLICPILTDFDYLYLDYNAPNNPKIVYPTNSEKITSAYDELTKESEIIYEKKQFSLKNSIRVNEDNEFDIFGIAGKPQPNFEDEPLTYPRCPITNNKMKFVIQLFSNGHLKTVSKNFIAKSDYEENIHKHMNFWDDGSLKVFIEPKSKIVAYTIQNT